MKHKFIVAADNDGTLRDTNNVKDAKLNAFCIETFGALSSDKVLPTQIHRAMLGRPMAEIFVEIARTVYGKTISLTEGQLITENLNNYIRDEYVSRPVFPGVREFFDKLKAMGIPMYILTGMEPDMVDDGLKAHGLDDLFIETLGAPATKEQNVDYLLKKHPEARIIAFGDAMSEYKVTMAHEGTIFIAVDMENREKRVFPDNVKVYTSFDEEMYNDLIAQMN